MVGPAAAWCPRRVGWIALPRSPSTVRSASTTRPKHHRLDRPALRRLIAEPSGAGAARPPANKKQKEKEGVPGRRPALSSCFAVPDLRRRLLAGPFPRRDVRAAPMARKSGPGSSRSRGEKTSAVFAATSWSFEKKVDPKSWRPHKPGRPPLPRLGGETLLPSTTSTSPNRCIPKRWRRSSPACCSSV